MPQDKPLDVEALRRRVINTLFEAIRTTEKLAKASDIKPGPQGGIPPMAKWYQVMAYLSQTINGLLENADVNLTKKNLAELQKIVVQLQERAAKTQP